MNKLKICVVIPSFYPAVIYGGPIFSSYNTCKSLASLGHQVGVSTTNTNMYSRLQVKTGKYVDLENFKVKYYNETIIDKISLPMLVGLWKDIKPCDVLHVQAIFNTPTPIALLYSKLFNKPVLLSPRGVLGDWIMNQGSGFKRKWLKYFIKPFANSVTWHATSDQEKNEILAHFPEASVAVIPNGIDLKSFNKNQEIDKNTYISKFTSGGINYSRIIVSMGRLHKKKGFDILIKSFNLVKRIHTDAALIIAGDDEGELKNLQILKAASPFANDIFIIPAIHGEEKVEFLMGADIFVLPSHNENFGNVYAEALAAGTPIIASTHTPWNEVEKYKCGKWVPNTPEMTCNAILEILQTDTQTLRENARNYIKKYSWETIAQSFEQLFLTLRRF